MRTKKIIYIGLMGVLVLAMSGVVFGQSENEEKKITKRTANEISGEISAIGKDFIAIIYKRDEEKGTEYEMFLPIDTDTKLERKRNLTELSIGDTFKIQCEDTALEDTSGEKKMERKAKVISFVKPAVKKPEPPRPPEPGERILDDK